MSNSLVPVYHLQREYNFSTDEIYATIEIGDYDALIKRISDLASDPKYRTELADIIHRNHTSRSGFWSWMSNDIEEWFGLIVDPDNNHYVSYMIGYLMQLIDLNGLMNLITICMNTLSAIQIYIVSIRLQI